MAGGDPALPPNEARLCDIIGIAGSSPAMTANGSNSSELCSRSAPSVGFHVIAAGSAHGRLQFLPVQAVRTTYFREGGVDAVLHALQSANVDVRLCAREQGGDPLGFSAHAVLHVFLGLSGEARKDEVL